MNGSLFARAASLAWPVRLAIFLAAVGLVVLASSLSGQEEALTALPPYLVNLGHGPLYGLLALGLLLLLGPAGPLRTGGRFGAVLLVFLAGLLDEWHQLGLPSRGSDLKDLVTDLLGAVCALLLAAWAARFPVAPARLLPFAAALVILLLWAVVATEAPPVPLPLPAP